jgi:gluconate kinase
LLSKKFMPCQSTNSQFTHLNMFTTDMEEVMVDTEDMEEMAVMRSTSNIQPAETVNIE